MQPVEGQPGTFAVVVHLPPGCACLLGTEAALPLCSERLAAFSFQHAVASSSSAASRSCARLGCCRCRCLVMVQYMSIVDSLVSLLGALASFFPATLTPTTIPCSTAPCQLWRHCLLTALFNAPIPCHCRYHQYKFIVDGEWRHDESQPFMPDPLGNVNNWCGEGKGALGGQDSGVVQQGRPHRGWRGAACPTLGSDRLAQRASSLGNRGVPPCAVCRCASLHHSADAWELPR